MIDCLRYLNITDMYTIETMSLYEYGVRMKAFELKQIDEEYRDHRFAWIATRVKDTKAVGKNKSAPVYKSFKDFFDYRRALQDAGEQIEPAQEERLKEIARRLQERRCTDGQY